ncbi:hypothetical protein APR12_001643 [Nocardia amikacinitolerans]|uniref:hypothetical protein n=1 Tax=Nocardia amikacinitolerans TaxID=756689 RepID=UPI00082E083B|nr:hypothetical protein [Nocardia amikacinitolerans]MCP2316306.1 hypothetical protein [Nocardia amikacinitolerans]
MGVELAVELRRLEKEGSTGVLRAGDGAFHLTGGVIASADCRRTTGLDRLVVEAGVATAEDWRRAGSGDPGQVLNRPRLETLALLSVFDAAYFLLASSAVPEFRPAPPHWLAPVCHITPRALVQECARRGDPESGPWPAELVDRAPVVPVRRVRRRHVVLTAGQAEVLAAADTQRSITGIARDLGRTTYGCLEAVRELTAAGLINPPSPVADPGRHTAHWGAGFAPYSGPQGVRVDTRNGKHAKMTGPGVAELSTHTGVSGAGRVIDIEAPTGESGGAREDEPPTPLISDPTAPPLRRRVRSTPLPTAEQWEPVDRDVLVRLRAALEELA